MSYHHIAISVPAATSAALTTPTTTATEDERPFQCPEPGCYQRFKRKFTLKEHIKTHTGEKPFVCPVKACGRTFTTSGNLARHKRLHPWLKPQACLVDGCDRSFSNEMKLERHMKTHFKGPRVLHPCRFRGCTKQFTTTGNLTRHIKQQHSGQELPATTDDASTSEEEDEGQLSTPQPPVKGDTTAVQSPCGIDAKVFYQPLPLKTWPNSAGAYNPLSLDECSHIDDQELLETLACLFE